MEHTLTKQPVLTAENVCARCAAMGTCCCSANPAEAHLCFPLSRNEWQQIFPYRHLARIPAAELGDVIPPGDVVRALEQNDPGFVISLRHIFPEDADTISSLFPEGGTHFRLRTTHQGHCVFLGEKGCVLPREVRPWYCLLFPAWVSNGSHTLLMAETCLIIKNTTSVSQGFQLQGVTKQEVSRLYAALRQDWGLPPVQTS